MPADTGEPVVTTVCFLPLHTGCGCIGHPAFPAPSFPRRESSTHNPSISCRGIADPHLKWRVRRGEGEPAPRFFLPLWHFPLPRKRFMVPRVFAIGKLGLFITITGLAVS